MESIISDNDLARIKMRELPKKVHCLGIGGIGVSGVAALLRAKGVEVSGCDARIAPNMRSWLEARGIKVYDEHSVAHLENDLPDLIIRTPAVADDNAELLFATKHSVPVLRRGETLAMLASMPGSIAVSGTHGKTTTSCFVTTLFRELVDANTGWCIGGYTQSMGGVAKPPAQAAPLVVEADESDGTLALYAPDITVITAIDHDHMEHFDSFDSLKNCFREVVSSTRRSVIYYADDPNIADVISSSDAISYGFTENAQLRAQEVVCSAAKSQFKVFYKGESLGSCEINVPGKHNVLNALAALGVVIAWGVDPAKAVQSLPKLKELPLRRYEVYTIGDGIEVVSDYSHHPAEIRALVQTALLRPHRKLHAIFQPHRYTRTKALLKDFPGSFEGIDELLLLPVYAASEMPIDGGQSADLYSEFRKANSVNCKIPVPKLAPNVEVAADYYKSMLGLAKGDVLLVIGAGDIVSLVELLHDGNFSSKAILPKAENMPRVSYGLPLIADEYIEVSDKADLIELLKARDGIRFLGQGTNLLPSDLGVRGTVIKLKNDEFEILDDGETIRAGCGISGALLLAKLRDAGLSGLEYMAAIPGTLGGWLAMNAGTQFGSIGDRVVSIEALTKNGEAITVGKDACNFGYRSSPFLSDKVVVSATLRLARRDKDEIVGEMERYREKRFNFSGLRTAGSVFKNPEGISAGKILDDAGCKGMRIGGAYVSNRHANIIAADETATASDIIALIEQLQSRAQAQGFKLEPEVRLWY